MYGFISDQKKFYTFNGGNFFPFFCDFLKISSKIGIFCHPIRKKVDILLDFCPFDLIFFCKWKLITCIFIKYPLCSLLDGKKSQFLKKFLKNRKKREKIATANTKMVTICLIFVRLTWFFLQMKANYLYFHSMCISRVSWLHYYEIWPLFWFRIDFQKKMSAIMDFWLPRVTWRDYFFSFFHKFKLLAFRKCILSICFLHFFVCNFEL